MKRIQNTARNIFIMDDTAAYGRSEKEETSYQSLPTTPSRQMKENSATQALDGMLASAFDLMSDEDDMPLSDEATDTLVQNDHLISLYEEEVETRPAPFSMAISLLDNIMDSIAGQGESKRAPLFVAVFKSRFLA